MWAIDHRFSRSRHIKSTLYRLSHTYVLLSQSSCSSLTRPRHKWQDNVHYSIRLSRGIVQHWTVDMTINFSGFVTVSLSMCISDRQDNVYFRLFERYHFFFLQITVAGWRIQQQLAAESFLPAAAAILKCSNILRQQNIMPLELPSCVQHCHVSETMSSVKLNTLS
jgi:hypothetical protein